MDESGRRWERDKTGGCLCGNVRRGDGEPVGLSGPSHPCPEDWPESFDNTRGNAENTILPSLLLAQISPFPRGFVSVWPSTLSLRFSRIRIVGLVARFARYEKKSGDSWDFRPIA